MNETEFFPWALHELNKVLILAIATSRKSTWKAAEKIEHLIIEALREYQSTKH